MSVHKPVLLNETIEALNLKPDAVVVDATLGGGGHAHLIQEKIGEQGILIGIDADIKAIENFVEFPISNFQFPNNSQISIFKIQNNYLVNDNFENLENILETLKIEKADAILADLGWSSDQLKGKGMSFMQDEELDMRFSLRNTKNYECTKYENKNAKYIVNEYSEEELGRIIREYGEERFWRSIARKIVESRKIKKIETTKELAEIVKSGVPRKFRFGKIHLATKTFQALRIEVNQELENLEKFIPQAIEKLNTEGRLAIISFHSLEDRIVKNIFRENARGRILTDPITGQKIVQEPPKIKLINKKPIISGKEEVEENSRARSAKLRVCEKIHSKGK
jgi:16S rRNA (cytosine1402-N4)-methyltransferase